MLAWLAVSFLKIGILVCNVKIFVWFRASLLIATSGKNVMVIPFVAPEILGLVDPPPDAIKLSEKPDAINC